MGRFNMFIKINLVWAALIMAACIEDRGTVVSTSIPTSSSSEFSVPDAPVPPTPITPKPAETEVPAGGVYGDIGISINGPLVTRNPEVNVNIKYASWNYMRVSLNKNCSGGDWQPVADNKTITLPTGNLIYDIYAEFTDADFTFRTPCVSAQVKYDNEAPQILFTKYPLAVVNEGDPIELAYQVTDYSNIVSTVCTFQGVSKNCSAGGPHTVSWPALAAGEYTFAITAEDELGHQSTLSVAWSVSNLTKKLSQTFQLNDYRKVDIIMVIDNSGSMSYEQQSMAKRMNNFLPILNGLDWQIGVTTTDTRNIALGDGRLITLNGSSAEKPEYILNSTMDPVTAQYRLGMTLQRKEVGSALEQGIFAVYRAIERSFGGADVGFTGDASSQLIRKGAHLAALVISDEDESANGDKNDPQNLLNLIRTVYDGQKNFSFHSIITKPGDIDCLNTHGATYGNRYQAMSNLTGGIVGSVCATDYAKQLSGVANGIRNLLKTLTLQCEPLSQYPVEVKIDGVPFVEPFVVEGVNLRYATELPAGTLTVNYHCLK